MDVSEHTKCTDTNEQKSETNTPFCDKEVNGVLQNALYSQALHWNCLLYHQYYKLQQSTCHSYPCFGSHWPAFLDYDQYLYDLIL